MERVYYVLVLNNVIVICRKDEHSTRWLKKQKNKERWAENLVLMIQRETQGGARDRGAFLRALHLGHRQEDQEFKAWAVKEKVLVSNRQYISHVWNIPVNAYLYF